MVGPGPWHWPLGRNDETEFGCLRGKIWETLGKPADRREVGSHIPGQSLDGTFLPPPPPVSCCVLDSALLREETQVPPAPGKSCTSGSREEDQQEGCVGEGLKVLERCMSDCTYGVLIMHINE